uniref:Uncharacterized protein n=1 Tax=Arundo donax TaxID=35708 RepID=A0A0A9FA86_ARUDO
MHKADKIQTEESTFLFMFLGLSASLNLTYCSHVLQFLWKCGVLNGLQLQ